MSKKYLPIKIFEKRKDYDDRSTEGGGDSHEGSWVLHGEELYKRADYLNENVNAIQDSFRKWKENKRALPMIISTTVIDKAIAKTHRGRIVNLLENDGKDNVIGIYGDRQLLSMVTEESLLSTISQAIEKREDEATLISSISGIDVFSPFVEQYDSDNNVYRVRLCNYNDFDLNNMAKILFEKSCEEAGIEIHSKVRFTTDMTIYRVTIDSLEQFNAMGEFEGVYSAEKTHPIMATMDILDSDNLVAVKYPNETEEYPVVGVLDTGIVDIPHLVPWKETDEHKNYPKEYQDNSHGSFVAGIIEYGDELNGTNISALDGVRLFNAVVHPGNTMVIYPEELIDNVREAVEHNPEIKIWNLSLGTTMESELDEFSEFGMALDNIQDENNVLIIKSAGNCNNFAKGLPKSRISKMADSVRSLVVGSIAETQEVHDYAEVNMPSPFTRIGPGPASIVKPDLVYYGGNAGIDKGSMTPLGYHNESNCKGDTTFVIAAGTAGEVGYSQFEFWAAEDCYYFNCTEFLLNRYLYYLLKNKQGDILSKVRKASIPRLSRTVLEKMVIVIPPIQEQKRIIRLLDRFYKLCNDLSDGLPAEIKARQKQYEYYRDKLLDFKERIV